MSLPQKLSEYLKEYQRRHSLGKKELAGLVGLSPSSITRLEESAEGVSFKNLISISKLEYNNPSEFISFLEGGAGAPASPPVDDARRLDRMVQRVNDEVMEQFIDRSDVIDKDSNVGSRFAWAIRLANLMLEGTSTQLVEMEINVLNYYLNHINDSNKKARTRITSLLRNRFQI